MAIEDAANIKHRGMFANDVTCTHVAKPMVPATRSPVWPSRLVDRAIFQIFIKGDRLSHCQCGALRRNNFMSMMCFNNFDIGKPPITLAAFSSSYDVSANAKIGGKSNRNIGGGVNVACLPASSDPGLITIPLRRRQKARWFKVHLPGCNG